MVENDPASRCAPQVAAGTVQVPLTVEYATGSAGVPVATYPDQFGLTIMAGASDAETDFVVADATSTAAIRADLACAPPAPTAATASTATWAAPTPASLEHLLSPRAQEKAVRKGSLSTKRPLSFWPRP